MIDRFEVARLIVGLVIADDQLMSPLTDALGAFGVAAAGRGSSPPGRWSCPEGTKRPVRLIVDEGTQAHDFERDRGDSGGAGPGQADSPTVGGRGGETEDVENAPEPEALERLARERHSVGDPKAVGAAGRSTSSSPLPRSRTQRRCRHRAPRARHSRRWQGPRRGPGPAVPMTGTGASRTRSGGATGSGSQDPRASDRESTNREPRNSLRGRWRARLTATNWRHQRRLSAPRSRGPRNSSTV